MVRQFGMQSWIGKKVALFADVKVDGIGVDRLNAISEILLVVTGEDVRDWERKYQGTWSGMLNARIIMFSNELIKLRDDSGALPGRFITWQMKQSFWGREDFKLGETLKVERPGILNLALEALDELRKRDRFLQPKSGLEMSQELEELASYITMFINECCVIGVDQEALMSALFTRWQGWCAEKGIRWGIEEPQFSQKLRAKVPTITSSRPRSGGAGRPTHVFGIGLAPRMGKLLDRRI